MTVSVPDFENELQACAAGDHSAFLALYWHESAAMYALAQAMLGSEPEAQAVVHDTFVLIWRNAAGYSPAIGTARAWMYSILRHRARASRAHGNRPAPARPAHLPRLHFTDTQAGIGITGSLRSLSDPQRDALLCAYLHGGTFESIAAQLKRTEPDVRAALEAALQHLAEAVRA
ncbi:sigma factor [Castellaniella sp.]|uniref:sigma factor n=1 Tax=Castellaniella sp. TaxID=1955812 RepID=UPI00355E78AF